MARRTGACGIRALALSAYALSMPMLAMLRANVAGALAGRAISRCAPCSATRRAFHGHSMTFATLLGHDLTPSQETRYRHTALSHAVWRSQGQTRIVNIGGEANTPPPPRKGPFPARSTGRGGAVTSRRGAASACAPRWSCAKTTRFLRSRPKAGPGERGRAAVEQRS
jgi:hypothetical protein